jgi:hypothetical protein
MKNMEMISATALTSPNATKIIAIKQVIKDAFMGSLSLTRPFANQLFNAFEGKDLSIDNACKVLGATITDPIAEDIVDAANPNGTTMAPPNAILDMIN